MKVDKWDKKYIAINVLGFAFWLLATLWMIRQVEPFFALIYVIFILFYLVADRFLRCTRCCYFGTVCYCFGGKIASFIFRAQESKLEPVDDRIAGALLGILVVFPVVIFVFLSGADLGWVGKLGYSAIHLLLAGAWFFQHSKTACAFCKNVNCPLYRPE